ncbi:Zinc finger protein 181, partial [Frankliniella fusca]
CLRCGENFTGPKEFNTHFRNVIHPVPLICGHNGCERSFEHRSSLLRHCKQDHYEEGDHLPHDDSGGSSAENSEVNISLPDQNNDDDDHDGGVERQDLSNDEESSGSEDEPDLKKCAAKMVLDLRQTGGITNALVNRCQDACSDLVEDVAKTLRIKVKKFLVNENLVHTASAKALLREFNISDPFVGLKTLKQQLHYFATEMGLVVPVTYFLGYRTDHRLDPNTNEYVPTQVSMTCEYIPIIESLKLIIKNPELRHLIESDQASEDGVLRSYLDGNKAKDNPILRRHPNVIRIQLYVDDIETASALGSRTIIHKLTAFYFTIQNLPPEESSQLSSIFLLALAYSEDIKNLPDGYTKILHPFLEDLLRLQEGVEIRINDEIFILRAILVILCADTLAAHDILGFLSPSARHFCRVCMVSRPEFHVNCKAMGVPRTKESFLNHVQQVKDRVITSTECGVVRDTPLHCVGYFSAVDDAPFDIFHDILEGVAHVVTLLALRSFIVNKKLFTLSEFNDRVTAFSYGIPDIKNKPSANFTTKRLFSSHFLQKGSQTWCLIRVFGFLVSDVPSEDPYLKLVNLLQQCMMIIFAPEIREEDVTRLEVLIDELLGLFQQLHIGPIEILDVDEEEEMEAAAAGPAIEREVAVTPVNKLHHIHHYPKMIRDMGPPIRYWCMRYEARHHIFVKYATNMCNFINVPKSMAQMHQLCTLNGVLKRTLRKDNLELHSGEDLEANDSPYSELLIGSGLLPTNIVTDVGAAIIAGEDFRPGLFVVLKKIPLLFGIIKNVYHCEGRVFFIVRAWKTDERINKRYCAYRITPDMEAEPLCIEYKNLEHHLAYAHWNPFGKREKYISLRTILV